MRQVLIGAAGVLPRGSATVAGRDQAAVVCAMGAAAGRQQHLRLRQLERGSARKEQQHPAHQQVGNPPLHNSSLHAVESAPPVHWRA
jgi:hypothetical protein